MNKFPTRLFTNISFLRDVSKLSSQFQMLESTTTWSLENYKFWLKKIVIITWKSTGIHHIKKNQSILNKNKIKKYSTNPQKKARMKDKTQEKHHQRLQIIIFPSIFRIVISKSPHQYHRNQTSEKDNHHEWVENWEPMNLHIWRCIYNCVSES